MSFVGSYWAAVIRPAPSGARVAALGVATPQASYALLAGMIRMQFRQWRRTRASDTGNIDKMNFLRQATAVLLPDNLNFQRPSELAINRRSL